MAASGLLGLVVAIVGLVVQVLALALPYWYRVENGPIEAYGGLWKSCYETPIVERCNTNYSVEVSEATWFDAVKAMEVLGFISAVLCLVFVVLVTFVKSLSDNTVVRLLAKIFALAAAVFIIIGVIIYGAEVQENLHAAFGLAIIAFLIFAAEFVILIAVK